MRLSVVYLDPIQISGSGTSLDVRKRRHSARSSSFSSQSKRTQRRHVQPIVEMVDSIQFPDGPEFREAVANRILRRRRNESFVTVDQLLPPALKLLQDTLQELESCPRIQKVCVKA